MGTGDLDEEERRYWGTGDFEPTVYNTDIVDRSIAYLQQEYKRPYLRPERDLGLDESLVVNLKMVADTMF